MNNTQHTNLTTIYEILIILGKLIESKIIMEKTWFPTSDIKEEHVLFICVVKLGF